MAKQLRRLRRAVVRAVSDPESFMSQVWCTVPRLQSPDTDERFKEIEFK